MLGLVCCGGGKLPLGRPRRRDCRQLTLLSDDWQVLSLQFSFYCFICWLRLCGWRASSRPACSSRKPCWPALAHYHEFALAPSLINCMFALAGPVCAGLLPPCPALHSQHPTLAQQLPAGKISVPRFDVGGIFIPTLPRTQTLSKLMNRHKILCVLLESLQTWTWLSLYSICVCPQCIVETTQHLLLLCFSTTVAQHCNPAISVTVGGQGHVPNTHSRRRSLL